jgi:hypothetical protein
MKRKFFLGFVLVSLLIFFGGQKAMCKRKDCSAVLQNCLKVGIPHDICAGIWYDCMTNM